MKIFDALRLAYEAMERDRLMYREEFRLTAKQVNGEWVFWFVFLPQAFGLDVTAIVSDDGKVRFGPGM